MQIALEVARQDILRIRQRLFFDHALIPQTIFDRLVTALHLFNRHGYKRLAEARHWPIDVEASINYELPALLDNIEAGTLDGLRLNRP